MQIELHVKNNQLTVRIDLSQPQGDIVALGALRKAEELVCGYFVHKAMIEQQKKSLGIVVPGLIKNGGGAHG